MENAKLIYGYIEDMLKRDIFSNSYEEYDDDVKFYNAYVSIFNRDERIQIDYIEDEDVVYMTDDYGNRESFTYLVEENDFFLFKEKFMDNLEKLLKKTIVDAMYDVINN